jgi:hypothetical protein
VVYNRDDDDEREPPRDLTMTKTKSGKGSKDGDGIISVEIKQEVQIKTGVPKMDEKIGAARYARERI